MFIYCLLTQEKKKEPLETMEGAVGSPSLITPPFHSPYLSMCAHVDPFPHNEGLSGVLRDQGIMVSFPRACMGHADGERKLADINIPGWVKQTVSGVCILNLTWGV